MDPKILGKLTARWLIHFGAVEMSFTILLCYALAVANNHVKPWLPTISACGEHPPEQYPFRFGIMVGAMLLFVEAISLHSAKRSSIPTYVMGAVASICLGVVAVVASNENDTVHTGIHKQLINVSRLNASLRNMISCNSFIDLNNLLYTLLYTVAAVTFFVLEDIMSVLLTMDLARRISRLSLGIKIISTTVAVVSTVVKCILYIQCSFHDD